MKRALTHTLHALALLALLAPATARAEDPDLSTANECTGAGGEGEPCSSDRDCESNVYARTCIETPGSFPRVGTCRIGCGTASQAEPSVCALGETCTSGKLFTGGSQFHCQASRFRMDLNLLDQCVVHYLEGRAPVFSDNVCSLERNLNTLLDQNGDQRFDIFDLDLCVVSFLEQPGCRSAGDCDADDLTYCDEDEDCGRGLYCDSERNTCQRDCGLISSREESLGVLERTCSGHLRNCDFERGRCDRLDTQQVTRLTCEADSQCPAGAYCLVGRCAPNCYRALDCPDSGWVCTANNKCRARPQSDEGDDAGFDPQNFAIRFARSSLNLNAIEDEDNSQLVIIDLTTQRQVRNRGAVSFGYRMEVNYDLKQDTACLRPFIDCTDAASRQDESQEACEARQDDCFVSADEEWIRLISPFGTVSAAGEPAIAVELEDAVAEDLSPGVYTATLRLIFDNGDSDSVRVRYTKASPSGFYDGSMSVYHEEPGASLTGSRPLRFEMQLEVTDEFTDWHSLTTRHNLAEAETLRDTTRGFVVHGAMNGSSTFAFSKGDARQRADDVVPFVGLYSPDLNRMRLLGVIDIAANFCVGENGTCATGETDEIQAYNPFGRAIRRQLEFVGPFEEATGRFSGLYRERIAGLSPSGDITLEGGFILDQRLADGSDVEIPAALVAANSEPSYPTTAAVLADVQRDIDAFCGNATAVGTAANFFTSLAATSADLNNKGKAAGLFASESTFDSYMAQARRSGYPSSDQVLGRSTIFPDAVKFSQEIDTALSALNTSPDRAQDHLNIYDFLSSRLLFCDQVRNDGTGSPSPACIDETAVRCGLALHQKALLNGWVTADQIAPPADPEAEDEDELCDGDLVSDGVGGCECPVPEMTEEAGNVCLCAEGCVCPEGFRKDTANRCVFELRGSHDLFCVDTFPTSGCANSGATHPDLLAYQEHNRFWRYVGEILRFEAGKERSDAFMVLFRNAINPFAAGTALSFKSDRLRSSLDKYDQLVELSMSSAGAKILYNWPARSFKQSGGDWIGIMQAAAEERLDTIADAVDLKRRIFLTSSSADFTFAQHLMQFVYLSQVFTMDLQKVWQREQFDWDGSSAAIFEQGQQIVNQLNPAKNAFGLTPDVVFFENSDTELTNWENYRAQLVGVDGDGGFVADTSELIDEAVANLQDSLADLDAFEESLRDSHEGLIGTLNEICGDPTPQVGARTEANYCAQLAAQYGDYAEWKRLRDCRFGGPAAANCPANVQFTCASRNGFVDDKNQGSCAEVVSVFDSATDAISNTSSTSSDGLLRAPPTCELNTATQRIIVNGQPRACVGGEIGGLLQEKATVDLQRRLVIDSVYTLTRQIESMLTTAEEIDDKLLSNETGRGFLIALVVALEASIGFASGAAEASDKLADGADCTIIVGFSFGTDCVGNAVNSVIDFSLKAVFTALAGVLSAAKEGFEQSIDRLDRDLDRNVSLREADGEALQMAREIDGLISEYQVLTQESFNLGAQIEHQRYLAQEAVDLHRRDVTFVADHLVGRETGNLLLGNDLVRAASGSFRDASKIAHKMAVAFIHQFNLPESEAASLVGLIEGAVTIDDIEDFVGLLDDRARDYCGREGIDCDAGSNTETLRVSLRELLFPNFRDIAGGPTAGEQFHNTITRPPFVRRRVRGTETVDQIELSFVLPLNLRERSDGQTPTWLIDPLSCNHVLADDELGSRTGVGNLAANFVGRNLDDDPGQRLRYQIARGGTDFIRACSPEPVIREIGTLPVLEYPVNTWVVSYPPSNSNANLDAPPSFVTVSQPFNACLNGEENQGSLEELNCWRLFARDRSLSAQDWRLILPLTVGDGDTQNAWVLGEDLSEDERPLIEDIVLYFRYRSRPIQEL